MDNLDKPILDGLNKDFPGFEGDFFKLVEDCNLNDLVSDLLKYAASHYFFVTRGMDNNQLKRKRTHANNYYRQYNDLFSALKSKESKGILFRFKEGNVTITSPELTDKILNILKKHIVNEAIPHGLEWPSIIDGEDKLRNVFGNEQYETYKQNPRDAKDLRRSVLRKTKDMYEYIKSNSKLSEDETRKFIVQLLDLLKFDWLDLKGKPLNKKIDHLDRVHKGND